jgi:hypothetical protein
MKSRRLAAVAACVLLGVLACGKPTPPPPAKCVVVLIDLSLSAAEPAMRRVYADAIKTIFASLKPGDALFAGWITDRSAGELILPVKLDLPRFQPSTDNPLVVEAERAQALAALALETGKACDGLIADLESPRPKILKTHIMASLSLAERVFPKLGRPRNVLVLMSDMLEDSDRYIFKDLQLTPQATGKIVADEAAANRIAALAGAHIYVVGASGATDDKILAVRDFWLGYFKAAGADLRAEDYGPLIVFAE